MTRDPAEPLAKGPGPCLPLPMRVQRDGQLTGMVEPLGANRVRPERLHAERPQHAPLLEVEHDVGEAPPGCIAGRPGCEEPLRVRPPVRMPIELGAMHVLGGVGHGERVGVGRTSRRPNGARRPGALDDD
jgi:hypothetical protein